MHRFGLVRVRGRSMHPTLHEGDRLLVAYDAVPRPGDLVLALVSSRGGGPQPVVKRAGWREPGGWFLERDNPAEGVDSWAVGVVADCDVLGVVRVRVWPWGGRGPRWMFRPVRD